MKRTKTELSGIKGKPDNIFMETGGLSYQEMKDLKAGQKLKIFFAGVWHTGKFVRHHPVTNVSEIIFESRVSRRNQKKNFVPNGLNFDENTFNQISAGSHFKKI